MGKRRTKRWRRVGLIPVENSWYKTRLAILGMAVLAILGDFGWSIMHLARVSALALLVATAGILFAAAILLEE